MLAVRHWGWVAFSRMGELAGRKKQSFALKYATKHCVLGRISNLSVSL